MTRKKNRNLERLEVRNLLAADVGINEDLLFTAHSDTEQVVAAEFRTSGESLSIIFDASAFPSGFSIPVTTVEPRSVDGTGNNLENPEFGSTGVRLLRTAAADYADGISALAGEDRPSAREISNAIAAQDPDAQGNEQQLSAFIYVWGQFLDHDIDLTDAGNTETAFIDVPTDDRYFDPEGTGVQFIPFVRSVFDTTTGDSADNAREQINQITAFIDGSQVYGSDQATADSLRTFEGGKLLTSEGNLLPTDENGNFLSGDIRVNENIELTSMQTLFMREHNLWADQIAEQNPALTDEEIYQQARAIVVAEIQIITYQEFLPALLGENAIADYQGYNATINPGIANEFSTAAFRLGHSFLNDDVEFFGNDGRAVFEEVALAEAFFNPSIIQETGIDSILKYAASSQSQELDNQIVDSVRNFLFGEPGEGGLDLASLNIQRGRDHGLADYNSVREAYGLERVSSFAEITSDLELQQKLADLYDTVDNIDLWVGALAEDHLPGSSVGELTQTILVDQFTRLRDGDRFWYENIFSADDVDQLQQTKLSTIIQRNSTVTNIQDDVFHMTATVTGTVVAEATGKGTQGSREQNLSGVTVELLNDEGTVLDSTITDSRGSYSFNSFLETGDYQVRVTRPTAKGTVTETADILISVGDQLVSDINFGTKIKDRDDRGGRDHGRNSRFAVVDDAFDKLEGSNNAEFDALAEEIMRRSGRRGRFA